MSARFRARAIIVSATLLLLFLCGCGVAGYFQLGSEATILRKCIMTSVPGQWDKKIAVHLGGLTCGLVRAGSRLFNLPPEPRAALEAVHGVEVGVYKLQEQPVSLNRQAIFSKADQAMTARGWLRVVGVAKGTDIVAIYIPRTGFSARQMSCCLLVLDDQNLVVASARGNPQPLLAIAAKHLPRSHAPTLLRS